MSFSSESSAFSTALASVDFVVTQAATREVSPVAFGFFGVVTLALAHRWVLVDADNAFKTAVSKGHVLLAGAPPHVTYIDSACPGRWLVVLHVQLHPELINAGFA